MQYLIASLGIVSLFLGITVILRNHTEKTHIAFLCFTLSLSVWSFNNFYRYPQPSLEVLRVSYGLAVLMGMTYLIWIYFFLKRSIPKVFFYLVIPAFLALFFITTKTDLILKNLYSANEAGFDGELGSYYLLFTAFFTLVIFLSLYYLIQGRVAATDLVQKKKITIVIWGISLFALNSFSVDFWIPRVFGKLHYTLFDNIGFLILLSCMAYVMLKRITVNVNDHPLMDHTPITLSKDGELSLPPLEAEKTYDEYFDKAPKVVDSQETDTTYSNK